MNAAYGKTSYVVLQEGCFSCLGVQQSKSIHMNESPFVNHCTNTVIQRFFKFSVPQSKLKLRAIISPLAEGKPSAMTWQAS